MSISSDEIAGLCGDLFWEEFDDIAPDDVERRKERLHEFYYRTLTPVKFWHRAVEALDAAGFRVVRHPTVAIWRAVLAHLVENGWGDLHDGCENDPPDECSLYHTIKEAAEKET